MAEMIFADCDTRSPNSGALLPKRRLFGNKILDLNPADEDVVSVGVDVGPVACGRDINLFWLGCSEGATAPPNWASNFEKSGLLSKERGREGKLRSLK